MSNKIFFYKTNEEHGYMSNFSRHAIVIDGKSYMTTEHYFQSKKAEGTSYEKKIANAFSPSESARLGRSRDFELRKDWEQIKDDVMRKAVLAKFEQHPDIREKLLNTGNATLVENTTTDYYWGARTNGSGKNMLGIILMEVRKQLSK